MLKCRVCEKWIGVILITFVSIIPVYAQYSMGVTGLLNIPSADMQPDGLFMAGGNFLPNEMMPDVWNYNTGNYFMNITFFSFMEVAYRCTLMKGEVKAGQRREQDRSVTLRLRPLKEGIYRPAIVVGSNDIINTSELNPLKSSGNRYFASAYTVATKHVELDGHLLGFTLGGYFFSRHSFSRSVFGGMRYTPSFLKPVNLLAEYDTNGINIGVTARLFGHFSAHLFSYDFKVVSGGLRYEFQLIH